MRPLTLLTARIRVTQDRDLRTVGKRDDLTQIGRIDPVDRSAGTRDRTQIAGFARLQRPEIRRASVVEGGRHGPSRTRPVCFDAAAGYVDATVLWRPDLAAGTTVEGPAIIEEYGSTVPIHPGFAARVDDYRNLIVTREHS